MNRRIEYLVMDVDGTLTDGKIYIGAGGELMKAFCAKDGYGIVHLLPEAGISPVILTGRTSDIVRRRCEELGITMVLQQCADKTKALQDLVSDQRTDLSHIAYIGDDLNDLPAMDLVRSGGGLTGCPADACRKVRESAWFASSFKGGEGAVREFIERILDN